MRVDKGQGGALRGIRKMGRQEGEKGERSEEE